MNVFDYVYGFSTQNGIVGIVRADSYCEAIDRIESKYCNDSVKAIICMNELDDPDYGVIGLNDSIHDGDWWAVDLRSRKTGDSIATIYYGRSYDKAWEVRNEWFKANMPDWNDDNDVMDLIDGSNGVFAYVFQLEKGEGAV